MYNPTVSTVCFLALLPVAFVSAQPTGGYARQQLQKPILPPSGWNSNAPLGKRTPPGNYLTSLIKTNSESEGINWKKALAHRPLDIASFAVDRLTPKEWDGLEPRKSTWGPGGKYAEYDDYVPPSYRSSFTGRTTDYGTREKKMVIPGLSKDQKNSLLLTKSSDGQASSSSEELGLKLVKQPGQPQKQPYLASKHEKRATPSAISQRYLYPSGYWQDVLEEVVQHAWERKLREMQRAHSGLQPVIVEAPNVQPVLIQPALDSSVYAESKLTLLSYVPERLVDVGSLRSSLFSKPLALQT
ncbi:hypothetical protein BJ508DRAFT_314259 [Ascobolus immersus RN42]|uniref:Uncharacterized protein n=1 Tax=Ascobolus immersus RN42 TaxID=1160509 RepID=A0A3N4HFK8_ASCIM|nr:hypothetical protein BJ508DRAFT_314259 [Ascobolus immersus RN42]